MHDLVDADTELEATVDASMSRDATSDRENVTANAPSLHGRFVILNVLGSGGMGTVYAAWDTKLDRRVALKVLRADIVGNSFERRRRLLAEARAMAQLAHPNVIGIHDVLEEDAQIVLAMEYVDGGTLRSFVETNPTVDKILDVLMDAGRGLAAAHARGILHRDFKPDNVLLGRDGRVRVADFGIASHLRTSSENAESETSTWAKALPTTVTTLAGTMGYIAPEALRQEPVRAFADQFSFCVTAWEALTGTLPSENAPIVYPRGIDSNLSRVFLRGISDKPEDRHPTMEALLDALSWARQSRLRRARWAVAMTIVVVIVGVFAWWSWREATACNEGDRWAELAWGLARRNDVQRAFRQNGLDDAQRLHDELDRRVSARAEAWRSGFQTTCQDLRRAEPQQRAALAGRLACFQRRLGVLQAVTTRWASADVVALSRTPTEVDGLDNYDDCPLGTTLGYAVLPDDPTQAMKAQTLRNELDGLTARLLTMSSADSDALVGELRRVANRSAEVGDHFSTAGARCLEANIVCANGGQPEVCMDSLRVAASEALAANDTETALHAFGYLAIYQAMAGHGDQARFHVTLAEGLLEQLRRPVRLDAEFHIHRGLMLRALGDLPAAAEDLQLAVDLRNRVYGQDSLETAQAKNNLAAVLYSLRRFVEAERLYLEVLALRTRRLGPKHSSRLVLLHNLGALYTDTDRFAEALSLFDDVLAQMPDVGGKPHPHRRTVQSFRGAALLGLGRTDEAEAAVRESLAQTEALLGVDSPESVMALVTLVEVAVARGNITADTILLAARAVKLSETKAKAAPLWARALFVQARVLAPSDPAQARLLVHRAMAALPKETLPLAVEQRHIEKVRALVENR